MKKRVSFVTGCIVVLVAVGYLAATHPDKATAMAAVAGVLVAVAGVLVAIHVFREEAKRSHFQAGVEILLDYTDKFDSEEVRIFRRTAAETLERKRDSTGAVGMENTDDVLDFFETISFLVRKGAISEEFVWHSFYYWFHRYFLLCRSYIEDSRKTDKAKWEDLCWFHTRLLEIEMEHAGKQNDIEVSETELDGFTKAERTIGERRT